MVLDPGYYVCISHVCCHTTFAGVWKYDFHAFVLGQANAKNFVARTKRNIGYSAFALPFATFAFGQSFKKLANENLFWRKSLTNEIWS